MGLLSKEQLEKTRLLSVINLIHYLGEGVTLGLFPIKYIKVFYIGFVVEIIGVDLNG